MSNDKTPYQLRLELLHLARSVIGENMDKKFTLRQQEKEANPNVKYDENDLVITLDAIVDMAQELNKFVSNNQG